MYHISSVPGKAQFHFVSRGPLLLQMSNGKQFSLESGDAVLTQPAFLMQETVPQTGLLSSSITFTRAALLSESPGKAQFHFVSRGPLLLQMSNGKQFSLESGDAVFIPNSDSRMPCNSSLVRSKVCWLIVFPDE
jgi:uncharacterized cupin superfamily protein